MKEITVYPRKGVQVGIYVHEELDNFFITNSELGKALGFRPGKEAKDKIKTYKNNYLHLLERYKHWDYIKVKTNGGMQTTTAFTRTGVVVLCSKINSEEAFEVRDWAENYNRKNYFRDHRNDSKISNIINEIFITCIEGGIEGEHQKKLTALIKELRENTLT
ncbi:hypothetical protein [Flammeovirga sp. SJP92]|uniref:hypothetical protein n=1 Tax=Flammeovirga sp. SJP92 TaxID=1775430 RepID=UPI00078900FA|nr:hypothetical protein [Flammeovirga sp. SJP92]KXX70621.1 hypothetical protein AVL50_07305 [Flammeovirga sp. SJP92]